MTPAIDLAKVVTQYLPLIKSAARRLNPLMAEEIAQETVVAIMRSKTFDPALGVAAWIRLEARGAYRKLRQMEHRHQQSSPPSGTAIESPVSPNQEDAVELSRVRSRAAGLPDRQRQVAELLLAGHEAGDIGELLGISHQGGHQLVNRTRLALAA